MKNAILCVDDDRTVLDSLRSLLSDSLRKECVVEVAESGEEALDLLDELREDSVDLKLVISDYIMPTMKGDELLIKMHAKVPRAVKIMLTGQSSLEGVVNAINHAGLYRFIHKPWDNKDLTMTVQSAIRSYDQDSRLEQQNAELRMLNEELEERVAARTRELSDLNANLQERVDQEVERRRRQEQLLVQQSKMAAMGEMLGVIAHQWKQPLSVMSLMMQEIGEIVQYENADETKLFEVRKKALEQIQYMGTTIDDFKNFFKPSSKKSIFSVTKSARSVCDLLEAKLNTLGIRAVFVDDEDFEIDGYPNEYRQVLMNIYNNACDVFKERGIKEGMIEFSCVRNGSGGEVRIRDNGGGIPDELLPDQLFQPYVSTKGERGTGIGLQICKTIIEEKFEGKLWVRNIPNGAEFIMEFPTIHL